MSTTNTGAQRLARGNGTSDVPRSPSDFMTIRTDPTGLPDPLWPVWDP